MGEMKISDLPKVQKMIKGFMTCEQTHWFFIQQEYNILQKSIDEELSNNQLLFIM